MVGRGDLPVLLKQKLPLREKLTGSRSHSPKGAMLDCFGVCAVLLSPRPDGGGDGEAERVMEGCGGPRTREAHRRTDFLQR